MPLWNKNTVSSLELYDWYKLTVKKHVDYKTFRKVLKLWGKYANEFLVEGKDIPLYYSFKKFGVRKKYKPTFIDKLETVRQGKRVIGSNSHSDFYGAKVYWKKLHTKFNIRGWIFMPSRKLSRAVAAIMKMPGGHRRYVEQIVVSGTAAKKRKKRFKL